jgi:hypothetical protein
MYDIKQIDELDKSVNSLVNATDSKYKYNLLPNVTNVYLSDNFPSGSIKAKSLSEIKSILGIDSHDEWARKSIDRLLSIEEDVRWVLETDKDTASGSNVRYINKESTLNYTSIEGSLETHKEQFALNGNHKILILLSNNTVEVKTLSETFILSRGDVVLLNTKLPHGLIITSGEDVQRWILIEGFTSVEQFPDDYVSIAINEGV